MPAVTVTVTGLNQDMQTNVDHTIEQALNAINFPNTKTGVDAIIQQTLVPAIQRALAPYGYFNPNISSSSFKQHQQWQAHLTVNSLGPPTRITRLTITLEGDGKQDQPFQAAVARSGLHVGGILNTNQYTELKQTLQNIATSRGYFDARFSSNTVMISRAHHTAQITLRFDTAKRYRFGHITTDPVPLDPALLHRLIPIQSGQYYRQKKLNRVEQNLVKSGYFNQSYVAPQIHLRQHQQVPTRITLKMRQRYSYIFGAGFGTDTGPRGKLSFDVRRVNSKGHRFNATVQGAKNNSFFSTTYTIPGFNPAEDQLNISASISRFKQINGRGNSKKIETQYLLSLSPHWKQHIGLTFLNENYDIKNLPKTTAAVLYPNASWEYSSAINRLTPKTNNFSLAINAAATPHLGLSKTQFYQIYVTAKSLHRFFHDNTDLILRVSAADTDIDKLANLPFSLQLFAGGARSIRGFNYNEIGPGRSLFTASVELQQRLYKKWYFAAFCDMGNVANHHVFQHLHLGIGPGIAWHSPIGILELTVGTAITEKGKPTMLQFTMGPQL